MNMQPSRKRNPRHKVQTKDILMYIILKMGIQSMLKSTQWFARYDVMKWMREKHMPSGCWACNWSKLPYSGLWGLVIAWWSVSEYWPWVWFPVTAFTFLSFASYYTASNMYWVHVCGIFYCKGQFGTFATLTWYTDVDSRQVVDVWLVCSTSQEPGVSRAFQITLPVGGNTPTQKVAIAEKFVITIAMLMKKTKNGSLVWPVARVVINVL